MDNLPNHLLSKIFFDNLDVDELLKCKTVSKRWNYVISKLKFNKLCLKFVSEERYSTLWYPDNRIIDTKELVFFNNIKIFKDYNFLSYFINLKYFKLCSDFSFVLENLPEFFELECLDLIDVRCIEFNKDYVLNFKKLKFLRMPLIENECLKVESQSLEMLSCIYDHQILLSNNDKLRSLSIDWTMQLKLKVYKNLETLSISSVENLDLISLFSFLPKNLKQLSLTSFNFFDLFKREDLIAFYEFKKNFENLDIYLNYIKLDHDIQSFLDKMSLLEEGKHYFACKNLKDIKQLSWYCINYGKILKAFDREPIPSDFFKKFNCINRVEITDNVKDQNQLISFLSGCPSINQLVFENARLNQDFFDKLPSICPYLEYFVEKEHHLGQRIKINFKFLSEFILLRLASTYQEISFIDLIAILKKLNLLCQITFYKNDDIFYSIKRIKRKSYEVYRSDKYGEQYSGLTINGLIDHLENSTTKKD